MRIIETGSRLELRDVPRGQWIFGLVFVASGSFVLTVPFIAREWRGFELWQRLAVVAIGVAHLAGGLMFVARARATVTELDRATNLGAQRVRRLWTSWRGADGSERTEFALDRARAVEIVGSKDSDGDPMYRVRLWLRGSESLWLQGQAVHGEKRVREQAERVRRFLGLDEKGLDAPGANAAD
jgi:hypothetical protein